MKRKNRTRRTQRLWSGVLAGAVLWVVFVAAGADSLAGALKAMGEEVPVALLRSQLGDPRREEPWVDGPTALVISQSALLLSSREAILELRSGAESDKDTGEEPPDTNQPVRETPEVPPAIDRTELTFADNGVEGRTLVPTSQEGYTVVGRAYISNSSIHEIDGSLFDEAFAAALGEEAPQVLIVHTHGSEAYTMPPGQEYVPSAESRTTDRNYNVVRVGDEIAATLADYGISVVHDRSMYDYPTYSGAYDRSLASIETYLEKYPSITVVLDIHRDAVSDGDGTPYKVVSADSGAAQMTFVVGTDGSGLTHDNWQENLKLAAAVQNTLMADDPTLMRPVVVRNSRYNQHCSPGSLLVEMGAAGNSLDEALLSARLLAEGLAETFGQTKTT